MGHESLIMQQSDIGAIADSVKDCLRCGKCKPVCATHVPRANLLYSPRNKILATSLLVEAFLYEEQTRRGVSIKHWDEFEDVADHCTVCHKCLRPCPVEHRFRRRVDEHAQPAAQDGPEELPARATRMAMMFLNATNPQTIKLMRTAMVDIGFKRAACRQQPAARAREPADRRAAVDRGHRAAQGAGDPLHQQEDAGRPAEEDGARAARHRGQALRPDHPRPEGDHRATPRRCSISPAAAPSGCSRRSAWRRRRCCGMPACRRCCRRVTCAAATRSAAAGQFDKAEKIITDNRVLFHRVANTLNYLDIKTVVVSCGTCYDQLQGYKFEEIFPGLPHHRHPRVPAREGHHARGLAGGGYLYHDPCHTPDEAAGPDEDRQGAGRRRTCSRASAAAAKAARSA